MENKNLIDFLVYSYFGIVPNDLYNNLYKTNDYDDYCVRKTIMKAYADATNQGAYNTLFKKDHPNIETLRNDSAEAKKNGAKFIFEAVKKMPCSNEGEFNAWHEDLCTGIVKEYENVKDNEPFFSYGNAQKWVNMTLKYIFLLNKYCGEYGKKVVYIKKYLHIPLDSYIISALKDNDVVINEKWSQIAEYGKSDDRNKASYMAYVNDIKEIAKAPIEWENTAWIEQAEKAKKKDKDKQYQSFWG